MIKLIIIPNNSSYISNFKISSLTSLNCAVNVHNLLWMSLFPESISMISCPNFYTINYYQNSGKKREPIIYSHKLFTFKTFYSYFKTNEFSAQRSSSMASSWEQHHLSVLFSIVKEEYIRRSSSLNDNVLFSKLFEMSYCVNRREGWNFDVFIYFRFFVHTTYFQKTILRFHHIVHNFFEFCFNVLLFSK